METTMVRWCCLKLLLLFPALTKSVLECTLTKRGCDYQGKLSTTKSGYTCQKWNKDHPHERTRALKEGQFPDQSFIKAKNYCRNPCIMKGSIRPWCYTTTFKVRWDFCDIPSCFDRTRVVLDQSPTIHKTSNITSATSRLEVSTPDLISTSNLTRILSFKDATHASTPSITLQPSYTKVQANATKKVFSNRKQALRNLAYTRSGSLVTQPVSSNEELLIVDKLQNTRSNVKERATSYKSENCDKFTSLILSKRSHATIPDDTSIARLSELNTDAFFLTTNDSARKACSDDILFILHFVCVLFLFYSTCLGLCEVFGYYCGNLVNDNG